MASYPAHPSRAMPLYCPICPNTYPTRKLLLEHLRSEPEESHKTLRFGACESAFYPTLLQQGVQACPRGCGAYFNGEENVVSKPLELHIGRRNCRDRRPLAPATKLDGPYLATTIDGVEAFLTTLARHAR